MSLEESETNNVNFQHEIPEKAFGADQSGFLSLRRIVLIESSQYLVFKAR